MNYVYHGSSVPNLKIIKPRKSAHIKEWVYGSPSIAVSTIFLSPMHSDYYYHLEGDGVNYDLILVERKEGMFREIFNYNGYIYILDGTNFKSGLTGWTAEVVSEHEEKVIDTIYVENIYEELIRLNREGKLKLYLYPLRPSYIPLDNSDLIPKVIRWQERGLNIDRFFEIYPELKEKYLEMIKNK